MPEFHRPPRLREVVVPREVTFPVAPHASHPRQRAPLGRLLLMTLLPSILPPTLLGVVTVITGQSSAILVTSVALASSLALALGLTTVLGRRDEDARERTEQAEVQAAEQAYLATFEAIDAACRADVERERRIIETAHPAPGEALARMSRRSARLWERRPADADFLEMRLGAGRRPTSLRFSAEARGAPAGSPARGIIDRYAQLADAPITATLPAGGRVGVCGEAAATQLMGWLALQVAGAHSPDEVSLTLLTRDESTIAWAKWLPHCRVVDGDRVHHLVGRTGVEASAALRLIAEEVASRPDRASGRRHVVIADARDWPSLRGRVTRRLSDAEDAVVLVLVEATFEHLAGECAWVAEVGAEAGRLLRDGESGDAPVFRAEGAPPEEARAAALSLASIDRADARAAGAIPRAARTSDILGSEVLTAAGISATWMRSGQAFRLAAPIGIGVGGTPVEIDLRRDGPHALLAGTTGSGKSELLQSLVVSLAARVPPDLLNFVLVDYKGGSAFREIAELPHVVGVVTDLDDRLAQRALASLRAELQRRERLLAASVPVASNIIEYQSVARPESLANLVIIIDEFHRLASEQPEFIEEMVRIAQQGRSLGVHLLLATQKPSGVVTDQIRANTNLRICLRVTDEADSRDVLGGPEAAAISRDLPGRAYLRVGNEPPVLCQVGRVSGLVPAPERPADRLAARAFLPAVVGAPRRRGTVAAAIADAREGDRAHDEDSAVVPGLRDERALIIDAVRTAAVARRVPPQAAPWQRPLPAQVDLAALPASDHVAAGSSAGGRAVVGILDEPELQRQRPFSIPLDGHILLAGAANSGKTTALLAIAAAAARDASPQRLHVYGIDFAGGGLAALDRLAHCGGVAAQHQPARVEWVLQALKDTVAERLSAAGVQPADRPRVIVLVDNFPALWSALQNSDAGQAATDELAELMDLGRSAGVTFAITAERPDGVRSTLLTMIETRLALTLADPEGYAVLGLGRPAKASALIPGRALVAGPVSHEAQIARPGELLDAADPTYVAPEPGRVPGGPPRIAPLPAAVPYADLFAEIAADVTDLRLGLRQGARPLFSYPAGEHLVVLGARRTGRSTALAVTLAECRRSGAVRAIVLNPRRSPVLAAAATDGGAMAVTYAEREPDLAAAWAAIVEEARARLSAYDAGGDPTASHAVVAIDDADVLEVPMEAADVLQQLALRGGDLGVTIVLAASTHALRSSYPSGAIRALLNLRSGVLLAPTAPEDFDFFGVRGRPTPMPPGRGYLCLAGEKHLVQIAAV